MDASDSIKSKKRNIGYMMASELAWKLKSKEDFIIYLDKHRKYIYLPYLIYL